jgi:tRNA nucleotidyltransferase/poly(A) polymerase
MLSGIIGKDSDDENEKKKRLRKSESDDSSPERIKNEILKSLDRKRAKEVEDK